jgi:PAS domain S-box-containing protein
MLRSYAMRYAIIGLLVAVALTIIHEWLQRVQSSLALSLAVVAPVAFAVFAYIIGRAHDQADAQAHYLATINQINQILVRSFDEVLPQALGQIAKALPVDHAALYVLEPDQITLRATTRDLPESVQNLMQTLKTEQWLPVLLPRTQQQRLVVLNLSDAPHLPPELQHSDYETLTSTLIQSEGQPVGLLVTASRGHPNLSRQQEDFLVTVAGLIGMALSRTRPYAEIKRRARDLDAIAQVNRTLLAGMALDDLLNMIVNAAQVRFGLPYVALLWVDQAADELFVRAHAGPLAAVAHPHHRQKLSQGLSARVYQTGRPYLARDVRMEPDYVALSDSSVLTSLLTPMKVADKIIGIMEFDSLGLDAFSEADVAAFTTLTDQVTIAAENARLYADAQRERNRVAAILRSTRDVIMLIGPDGSVQLINPAGERVLGVAAADAIGQPVERVLTEPALREAYQWMSGQASAEDSSPREVTLTNHAVYLATVTTAQDEAGAFFGRVLVMQDITYLKQLDQFRTQMIQMASHDLRNPLGVAVGYVELLTADLQPLTPLRSQVLQGLDHALARMQSLIADLLDVERIESGADRRREPVNLDQLTRTVVADLIEQAKAKRQILDVSIADRLPTLSGDSVRLKEALTNLIGNAIKYTPEGGRIWVRLVPDERNVIFEVQDTGYGISKANQARLFQRFFRAKTRGTEHIEGTGLGLSLVKAVIEQHGGRVSVDSDEGQGSIFRVELPLPQAESMVRSS